MNTQFIHKLFIKYQYYSLIYSNIDEYSVYHKNTTVLVSHILLYAKNYPNSNLAKNPIISKYHEYTGYRLIQNLDKVIRLL
jgi:hypothetical protein